MAEGHLQRREQTTTAVEETTTPPPEHSPTVVLKLKKPDPDKKVKWEEGTVDNEHLNKKKSKCCCIYEKPRIFGESDDESDHDDDDDCTEHCRGHKRKDFRKSENPKDSGQQPDGSGGSVPREPGSSNG